MRRTRHQTQTSGVPPLTLNAMLPSPFIRSLHLRGAGGGSSSFSQVGPPSSTRLYPPLRKPSSPRDQCKEQVGHHRMAVAQIRLSGGIPKMWSTTPFKCGASSEPTAEPQVRGGRRQPSKQAFSTLVTDTTPDLEVVSKSQVFPRHAITEREQIRSRTRLSTSQAREPKSGSQPSSQTPPPTCISSPADKPSPATPTQPSHRGHRTSDTVRPVLVFNVPA